MLKLFAEVIIPLNLRSTLTYQVPEDLMDIIQVGHRVEVQLGNRKRYAGIVSGLTESHHQVRQPREILDILDVDPIVYSWQIELWKWISEYYMCSLGEVLHAALPSGLKMSSESVIVLNGDQRIDDWQMNDAEQVIVEALQRRNEISIGDLEDILDRPNIYRIVKHLFEKEIILIKERLKEKSGAKTITYVELPKELAEDDDKFLSALDQCQRAPKQTKAMLALYDLSKKGPVLKKELQKKADINSSIIKTLKKKGLIVLEEKLAHEVIQASLQENPILNKEQQNALVDIKIDWKDKNVVLLQGVTGSGKTHIYAELIQSVIDQGEQALFLLPEIALTTQLIQRMEEIFGQQIVPYHSRLNDRERTAIYHVVKKGHPIILGARSSLLLPFKNLKLIVVDEEHDSSYKQMDPAPRYNARDVAMMMAHQQQIKVVLGSATPSIESLQNVAQKKLGYAKLSKRFNDVLLPEIRVVDMKKAYDKKQVVEHFAKEVLEEIKRTIERGKQVLIFQNRRGHSHLTRCTSCGWTAGCIKCDVSLTYHKVFKDIRCHYCGYREDVPRLCPECGHPHLDYKGLGTEKIEADLEVLLPGMRIERMDLDTARGTKARSSLIQRMEDHEVDILIGTQMVTKGLDFEHIALVVVPQADQLLFYPDFRNNERAFQLLQQVSGRAGRKDEQGLVMIQTFSPEHRVLNALLLNDQKGFYQIEVAERKAHGYPPFYKMIKIEIKHKKLPTAIRAAEELALRLKHHWKNRILGPAEPSVARVRTYYVRDIYIKYEKRADVTSALKKNLQDNIDETQRLKGLSGVRFNVNVDPL